VKIRKEFLQSLLDEGYDDTFEAGYDAAYMSMSSNQDWPEFTKGFNQAVEDMYKEIEY